MKDFEKKLEKALGLEAANRRYAPASAQRQLPVREIASLEIDANIVMQETGLPIKQATAWLAKHQENLEQVMVIAARNYIQKNQSL